MAIYKGKIRQKKTDGTYDYLLPETTIDQVYDPQNGEQLNETLDDLRQAITTATKGDKGDDGEKGDKGDPGLGDSRLDGYMMSIAPISDSANRIVNGLANHTTINNTTVEYTTNTTYGYIGFGIPNTVDKKYLAVTKITNIGTLNIPIIRVMLAYRTYELPGASNLNGMYIGASVALNQGQSHQIVTIFSTNDDTTANKSIHPHVSLGYSTSTNGANVRFEQRVYDVTNLSDKEINEVDWVNIVNNSILKATYANKAAVAEYLAYKGSTWKGKTWLTLGDSITSPGTYQNLVRNQLGFSTVVNRGVAGQSVLGMLNNVTDADIQNADLITLYGCFNNFSEGAPRLGEITDAPQSVMSGNSFISNLKYVIEYVLTKNPTAKFVIIGTHNGTDANRPDLYQPVNGTHNIGDYTEAMGDVARYYGLPFIDMYGKSGVNGFNLNQYTTDGLHLNSLGHQRIASVIVGELVKVEPI